MSFESLGLPAALARAVADSGYTQPTDVQLRAIPPAMAGSDLVVSSHRQRQDRGLRAAGVEPRARSARCGASRRSKRRDNKTVHGPRVLVLTPTRELAMQVAKATDSYGRHIPGLRVTTIVGGVPYHAQLKALRGPLDVLIATPGRLMDHMASGKAILANVEMLVLDEADRMLDMGFIDDIKHIASFLPEQRQTVMFSATFAGEVGQLATKHASRRADDRRGHAHQHAREHRAASALGRRWQAQACAAGAIADRSRVDQALIFTSTQRDADWLADRLAEIGHRVASLHGGMPQGRRNRVLHGLRTRDLRVLVATDVAARGIDVPSISHVINYGLPMKAEDYVHRIGRTGRAGRAGLAVTLAERRDAGMIQRIQRFTTQRIPVATMVGLEPRLPEPREYSAPRVAAPGKRGGKPFAPRRPQGAGFGHGAPRGAGPRR